MLVNSPALRPARFGEPISVYPPLGILYIASYLREKMDVSLKIIDGAKIGFNRTLRHIEKENADVMGLSFTTWSAPSAYKLINTIKENDSDTFVVSGGAHPSAMPWEVLKKCKTDLVVVGEGEKTTLEIVKQLSNGSRNFKTVKGVAFKNDNNVIITKPRECLDVDSIPFPARDLMDIKSYPGLYWSRRQPETNIVSSRGCRHRCTFCSNPVWRATKPWLRLRSPENIAEEVELLRDVFRIKEVSDECDTFNTNLGWAMKVCEKMKKTGLPWKVQIRANLVTDKLARLMSESGCWLVRIGIESANPSTLKGIRKGISIEDVMNACRKLKKHNIKVVGLFMIFNVWEENGKLKYESIRMCENTFRFVERLLKEKLIDSFSWAFATPFPASKLYEVARKYELIEEEDYGVWNQASSFVMKLPNITSDDISKVKMKGILLQAKSMLTCGGFNLRVIRLYFQRVLLMSKLLFGR